MIKRLKTGVLIATVLLSALAAAQDNSATCTKSVAVAEATSNGVYPSSATFIDHWWKKNGKHYPDICFSQTTKRGFQNFALVLAKDTNYFNGLYPTVVTYVSTTSTPYTANGMVYNQYGSWSYTSSGTVTATTRTTVQENLPYTDTNSSLYLNAYSSTGARVSSASHLYSSRQGGDPSNTLGYNLGGLIVAAGARGRMINHVIKDIAKFQSGGPEKPAAVSNQMDVNTKQGGREQAAADVITWFDEPAPGPTTEIKDVVLTAKAYDGVINILRKLRDSDTSVKTGVSILEVGYRPSSLNLASNLTRDQSVSVLQWDDETLVETTPVMHLRVTRKVYDNVTNVVGHLRVGTFTKQ